MDNKKIDLLIEEYRQAWEHYRHLENMRGWYLGFLFTFAAVIVGWTSEIINESKNNYSGDAYFTSLFLVSLLTALAITVFAAMINNRVGRHHYARVWRRIRKYIYENDFLEINSMVDVYIDPAVRTSTFSAGITSAWIIIAIVIVSITYLGLGVLRIWPQIDLEIWQRVTISCILFMLIAFFITVLYQAWKVFHIFQHPRDEINIESNTIVESNNKIKNP